MTGTLGWRGRGADARPTAILRLCALAVQGLATQKTRSFRPFDWPKICAFLRLLGQSCQSVQRLLKTLHRDDPQAVRVLPRIGGVLPAGTRKASTPASRAPIVFCLMPPIGPTRPFEEDLAGRRDLVAAVDVAAELLQDVEREREAGRRPADAARVDRDADRQLDRLAWSSRTPTIAALRAVARRRRS